MGTMNISLPEALKAFVDQQVRKRGFGTSSEFVRELIRKEQDRTRLRAMLQSGATSPVAGPADRSYFSSLRQRARRQARG